jgi:hypothetical protein
MNDKFLEALLRTACVERVEPDGSVIVTIKSHCVKYQVRVTYDDVTDKPTVLSYTVVRDKLLVMKEVTS